MSWEVHIQMKTSEQRIGIQEAFLCCSVFDSQRADVEGVALCISRPHRAGWHGAEGATRPGLPVTWLRPLTCRLSHYGKERSRWLLETSAGHAERTSTFPMLWHTSKVLHIFPQLFKSFPDLLYRLQADAFHCDLAAASQSKPLLYHTILWIGLVYFPQFSLQLNCAPLTGITYSLCL